MESHKIIDQLIIRYPPLSNCQEGIIEACNTLLAAFQDGGTLLICGNGGSCADADHIVGELMKSFERPRPLDKHMVDYLKSFDGKRGAYIAENLQGALPAISLFAHTSLVSAIVNDIDADLVFAQQVAGYGKKGDVLLAISTSGNSRNVLDGAIVARSMGIKVIGLSGSLGGQLKHLSDIPICVPTDETYAVQEYHLPIYHTFCRYVELEMYG